MVTFVPFCSFPYLLDWLDEKKNSFFAMLISMQKRGIVPGAILWKCVTVVVSYWKKLEPKP